ncbi:hypothetical protein DFH08DRAFT_817818 [Mycena albidolilacea]|uniref:Uncharacterized protein n=1 Tax=Mycena albidolilacea TaxID=1033008 RepID=A0AAD6ZHP6_9AGAR|nr:hypothetical protein DFH08DRAFT_817818 [Mycena albidolilacea]
MLSPGPHDLSQSSTNTASTTDSSTTPTTPANRKTYVAISLTSTSITDSTPTASAVTGVWVNTTSEFFVRSKKRRAPSTGVSPPPEDQDTYIGEEAPIKSNGKKANQ